MAEVIKYYDVKDQLTHYRISKTGDELAKLIINENINHLPIMFVCIGTDRSNGDSFGPLVGTFLRNKDILLAGTLENPVHFKNINEIKTDGYFVVCLDACLGENSNIGKIRVTNRSMKPGKGVGKVSKSIGNITIAGVVNFASLDNDRNFSILSNTRLNTVYNMAKTTSRILIRAINVLDKSEYSL